MTICVRILFKLMFRETARRSFLRTEADVRNTCLAAETHKIRRRTIIEELDRWN